MKLINNLKDAFEELLKSSKEKITIITGYVTIEGFEFVESFIKNKPIEKRILLKLNLLDFKNKSSTFDFRRAIQLGWKVYVDNTVHAKNYVFDDKHFLHSSANLTSNGLNLNHSRNDDNTVLLDYTDNFKYWIEDKFKEAVFVDKNKLDLIEDYIQKSCFLEDDKIMRMQRRLENILSNHNFNIKVSNIIQKEDEPFLKDLANSFRKNFIQKNALAFAEILSEKEIEEKYQINRNEEWYKDYIINLKETVPLEVFNHDNKLYRFTPRIYYYNQRYFRQKICNIIKNSNLFFEDEQNVKRILSALNHLFELGIIVDLSPYNIFLECTQKIKFLYFRPYKQSEKDKISEIYKSNLKKFIDKKFDYIINSFKVGETSGTNEANY